MRKLLFFLNVLVIIIISISLAEIKAVDAVKKIKVEEQKLPDIIRYIVKFKKGYLNKFITQQSNFGIIAIKPIFSKIKTNKIADGFFSDLYTITFKDKATADKNLVKLMAQFDYISPDSLVYVSDFNFKSIFKKIIPTSVPVEEENSELLETKELKFSSQPNDTFYYSQWYLNNTGQRYWGRNWVDFSLILKQGTADSDIDWPEAMDYLKKTEESASPLKRPIVVAVTDTGIDFNHTDLSGVVWKNPGEIPDNGVDDDNNGFIDDVYGWNFFDDNNNVADDDTHGTHVSGIIASLANNAKGIAGTRNNLNIKIMPVKFLTSGGWGYYSDALDAILYAAEMGADIINASWGGQDNADRNLMEAAVDYAFRKGVLIFAAAGNYGIDGQYVIPASFKNVISVGATSDDDELGNIDGYIYSNYGKVVKILAPGDDILSPIMYGSIPYFEHLKDQGEQYTPLTGTSMATPIVSAAAAILKTRYQNKYDILARLRFTADPVHTDKELGGGRLNLYNALIAEPHPELSFEKIDIIDNSIEADKDGILNQNETADLKIYIKNNWLDLSKIEAKLSIADINAIPDCIEILNDKSYYPNLNIGVIAFEKKPFFRVKATSICSDNSVIKMNLTITGVYGKNQYKTVLPFDLKVSPIIQYRKTVYLNQYMAGMTFGDLSSGMKQMIVVATIDGKILILNRNGELIKSWQTYLPDGQPDEFFYTNKPTLYDLNRDGIKEIIIGSMNGRLYVFNTKGQNLAGFPYIIYPTKILHNPYNDINISTVEIRGEPAIDDVNNDGWPEIIFGADNFKMYVLDRFGEVLAGWPIETEPGWTGYIPSLYKPYGFEGKPVIIDIDNDGFKEIVNASVNGKIYIFKLNGENYPNWPVIFDVDGVGVGLPIRSSVSVNDIDMDGILEVSADSVIRAYIGVWDINGHIKKGWPKEIDYTTGDQWDSSPHKVVDVNNDGQKEIIYAWSKYGYLFENRPNSNFVSIKSKPWFVQFVGQNRLGLPTTNWCVTNGQKAVGNLDRDNDLEIVFQVTDVWHDWGNVFAYNYDGTPVMNLYSNTNGMIGRDGGGFVTPIIANIDDDNKNEILTGSIWGRITIFDTMGQAVNSNGQAVNSDKDLKNSSFNNVKTLLKNFTLFLIPGLIDIIKKNYFR